MATVPTRSFANRYLNCPKLCHFYNIGVIPSRGNFMLTTISKRITALSHRYQFNVFTVRSGRIYIVLDPTANIDNPPFTYLKPLHLQTYIP